MTGPQPSTRLIIECATTHGPVDLVSCWSIGHGVDVATQVCAKEFADLVSITVVIADDSEIHRLNRDYRGHDVLAFDLSEEDESCAGEVYIALGVAAEQATVWGATLEQELNRLMVHGILHLAGYDHDSDQALAEMENKTAMYTGQIHATT